MYIDKNEFFSGLKSFFIGVHNENLPIEMGSVCELGIRGEHVYFLCSYHNTGSDQFFFSNLLNFINYFLSTGCIEVEGGAK